MKFPLFAKPFFMTETNNTIPKIIHQIWIGDPAKMPRRLMDTWRMQGWEYRLWTEKEIVEFGMGEESQRLYDYFYRKGCYYGASDVVRLEVLKREGGIYIDADTERLESLDDAPFLSADFFAVEANMKGRVANGIIGCVPEHPIIVAYLKAMGEAEKVEPVWSTIGGTLFTEMIDQHLTSHSQILPPHTFYPFDSKGEKSRTLGEGKTYAQHFWGSTHKSYGKL